MVFRGEIFFDSFDAGEILKENFKTNLFWNEFMRKRKRFEKKYPEENE